MEASVTPHPLIIIGLGNSMAGDDGVGPWIIHRLQQKVLPANVRLELIPAPGPEMVDMLDSAGEVWFIDAAKGEGLSPGEIVHRRIAPGEGAGLAGTPNLVSTHGLSLAELLRLASVLGKLKAPVQLWGVAGSRFEAGCGLSPEVESAATELTRRLQEALKSSDSSQR